MNNKGMLANLIGGFIVIMIGVTLLPVITQQLDLAMSCNSSVYVNATPSTQAPNGPTGSFGGAGTDYHFGGYDGEVKHKSFLSDYSVIQTNQSYIGCFNGFGDGPAATMLSMVPIFFIVAIVGVGLFQMYNAFRTVGVI